VAVALSMVTSELVGYVSFQGWLSKSSQPDEPRYRGSLHSVDTILYNRENLLCHLDCKFRLRVLLFIVFPHLTAARLVFHIGTDFDGRRTLIVSE